ELTEDVVRIRRVLGVAEPPARIAKPHLADAWLDPELELVVHALRTPALDAILIGGWPADRLDLRMAVENPIGDAVDPVTAIADLASGHVAEPLAQRRPEGTEHLLGSVQWDTADE